MGPNRQVPICCRSCEEPRIEASMIQGTPHGTKAANNTGPRASVDYRSWCVSKCGMHGTALTTFVRGPAFFPNGLRRRIREN